MEFTARGNSPAVDGHHFDEGIQYRSRSKDPDAAWPAGKGSIGVIERRGRTIKNRMIRAARDVAVSVAIVLWPRPAPRARRQ